MITYYITYQQTYLPGDAEIHNHKPTIAKDLYWVPKIGCHMIPEVKVSPLHDTNKTWDSQIHEFYAYDTTGKRSCQDELTWDSKMCMKWKY